MARIARRGALGAVLAGAAAGVAPLHFIRTARAQSRPRVVISGWGGATQQAMRDVYFAPFTRATGLPRLRAHWVKPEVVVRVAFIEWTAHGKLRHSRLLEVLEDTPARSVTRTT